MSRWIFHIAFHGIGTPAGAEREPGEHDYWIAEAEFLKVLDLCAARDDVRISFDDGNESDLTIGLPALRERGLRASFFPLAGRLGTPGNLSEEGVAALADAGMTIGSHGMDHRAWTGLDSAALKTELMDARSRLAEVAGRPVEQAACPLGAYDRRVLGRLRALGYTAVFTSDRRPAAPGDWPTPRFSMRASDTAESFADEVFGDRTTVTRLRGALAGAVKKWR